MIASFFIEFVFMLPKECTTSFGKCVVDDTKEVVEDNVMIEGFDKSSGGGLATFTFSQSLLLSNFLPSVKTGLGRLVCSVLQVSVIVVFSFLSSF